MSSVRRLRLAFTLYTLLLSLFSLLLLTLDIPSCPTLDLIFPLVLSLILHLTIFTLLLLTYLGCTPCLRGSGVFLTVVYFLIVVIMVMIQYFVMDTSCARHSPWVYSYLVSEVLVFYGIATWLLSQFGHIICIQGGDTREEELIQEALKRESYQLMDNTDYN